MDIPSRRNASRSGLSSPVTTAPQASNGPSASSGSQTPASPAILSPSTMQTMHERMVFLIMALVGTRVNAVCKNGSRYEGILASAITEGELGLALKHVRTLYVAGSPAGSTPSDEVKKNFVILGKDLLSVAPVEPVDILGRTSAPTQALPTSATGTSAENGQDTFKTDVDISASNNLPDRALKRWGDEDPNADDDSHLNINSATFGDTSKGAWDQFATNERLFGAKTDYNEELYTTKLDRSKDGFKEREKRAAALAQEIQSVRTRSLTLWRLH